MIQVHFLQDTFCSFTGDRSVRFTVHCTFVSSFLFSFLVSVHDCLTGAPCRAAILSHRTRYKYGVSGRKYRIC